MTYASTVLGNAAVLYLPLDETAGGVITDASGGGHNGTYGAGVTLGQAGLITAGKSFKPGTTASSVPYGSFMGPSAACSVEAWFKTSGAGLMAVAGHSDATGFSAHAGNQSRLYMSGGQLIWQVFRIDGQPIATLTSPATYHNGATHHVVGTWDGATMRLYVDGAQVTSGAAVGTMNDPGLAFCVGSMAGNFLFNGWLDEVAYYTAALSPAQVAADYAAGLAVAPTTSVYDHTGAPRSTYTMRGGLLVPTNPARFI